MYELYTNGKFDESLKEIKDFVKSMDKIAYDKMNEQYFDAYNHILLSTYAFIATSMKLNNYNEVKYAINYYKIGVPPAVYQTTAYALLYIKELMKVHTKYLKLGLSDFHILSTGLKNLNNIYFKCYNINNSYFERLEYFK